MATKSALQKLIEDVGYGTRSYSGRGMFGASCLAVDHAGNVFEFFATLLEFTDSYVGEVASEARAAVVSGLKHAKTDQMGLGTIVYFPGIEHFDLEDEEDDED